MIRRRLSVLVAVAARNSMLKERFFPAAAAHIGVCSTKTVCAVPYRTVRIDSNSTLYDQNTLVPALQ